jgi:hypothetical protein
MIFTLFQETIKNPDKLLLTMFVVFLFFIFYVYFSLIFYILSKKLKYCRPWLAWIPIINLFLVPILAKKKWHLGFFFFVPFLFIPIIYLISNNWLLFLYLMFILLIIIFTTSCFWKIFKQRKYPGWLSLSFLFVFSGFGFIIFLIVLSIVTFKDNK